MTRILILHDYAGRRGGAEIIAQDLRTQLRERGHDARLLSSDADPYDETEAPDYLCHGEAGHLRALTETVNLSAYSKLRSALSDFQPDIVHIFMFLTQLSPVVLALLKDVPTVVDINTYRPICPSGTRWIPDRGLCTLRAGDACRRAGCFSAIGMAPRRLQMSLLQRYRGHIDMTVAPSHAMAEILEANDWGVDRVLPYGVPDTGPPEERCATPLFGYAGRLVSEKGVAWLLTAFARAFGSSSAARLLVIGDGPERAALEALAGRLQIAHAVDFLGHRSRSETQSLLRPVWAQIIPSLWPEPFGLVTAEAMMRGSAVIVSDQGASREIVDDERAGFVVPANDVDRLSKALAALAQSPDRALAMGDAARTLAKQRYCADKWFNAYLAIYDDLLAKCGRSAA